MTTRPFSASVRRAPGQALVLTLFLLVLGVAGLLRLYDSGQLVHEKSRLTHAADAAAYSGALVQARALNFQAYANRTQMAHQVAMAHLVTLASWARFGATQAHQAAASNPPIGVVGMMFGADHAAAYGAALAAAGLDAGAAREGSLGRAFAEHERIVAEVLERAQRAVFETLPMARQSAMEAVLQANYDDAPPVTGGDVRLDPVLLGDNLPGYLAWHQGAARARLRNIVLRATDKYAFLDDRNHTARNPWVVSGRCPHRRHELRRRGATRLEGNDTWQSIDTQSYHALRSNRWVGCYFREYPMGWGVAAGGRINPEALEHVDAPPADFSSQDFWRWVTAHTNWDIFTGAANPLANSRALAAGTAWRSRGLPGYADIASAFAVDGNAMRFAIRVMRPQDSLAVLGRASRVSVAGRLFAGNTRLPADVMAAISAAETWFERPDAEKRNPAELASLFNPYWQARLSPVTDAERAVALSRQSRS